MVVAHRRQILARPDKFVLFETVADTQRSHAENKLYLMLHFEGSRLYEKNLGVIEAYFKLAVGFNLLAFNNHRTQTAEARLNVQNFFSVEKRKRVSKDHMRR